MKNNKIVKTISDYASQAPPELIMAYRKAMFNYQKLQLSKIDTDKGFAYSTSFTMDRSKKHIFLSQSESFLLLNEILNGRMVKVDFKGKYKMTFYDGIDLETEFIIDTDGRFYKYQNQVYDIGYNFIEINNLEKRNSPSWFVD